MDEQNNQVSELNLVEWLIELKKHIILIVVTTFLFAAASGLYLYKTAGSTYSYSLFINCTGLSERDMLTFVRLFQKDIGIAKKQDSKTYASLNGVELTKTGSDSRDIKDKYTNLMRFEFIGNNPDYVKKQGVQYVNNAVKKLNERIDRWQEANYKRSYLETVKNELTRINNVLVAEAIHNDGTISAKSTVNWLSRLKETLDLKEINKSYEKTYILTSHNDRPQKVGIDKSIIRKSAALGFFLSFAFVSCKYLGKVIRKN